MPTKRTWVFYSKFIYFWFRKHSRDLWNGAQVPSLLASDRHLPIAVLWVLLNPLETCHRWPLFFYAGVSLTILEPNSVSIIDDGSLSPPNNPLPFRFFRFPCLFSFYFSIRIRRYWLEYGRKWRLWSRKALLALHFVIFWLILNNWNKWEMASAHYVLDMKARLLQPPCSHRSDLGSMIRLHPINWHRIGVMRRSMTDSHHGIPRAQLL